LRVAQERIAAGSAEALKVAAARLRLHPLAQAPTAEDEH
jgi:hypothetical protein